MIIGVSGKISSGKDETARIIQYLSYLDKIGNKELSYKDFLKVKPGSYTGVSQSRSRSTFKLMIL